MSVILVTGATGFVGRAFLQVAEASRSGSSSFLLASRRPSEAISGLPPSPAFRPVGFDLQGSLELDERLDVVVHIAAEKSDESLMRRVNVEGVRRLLQWSSSHGVRRFVHISSVGSYGARKDSGLVREDASRHPQNEYERTKAESEKLVEDFCSASRIEWRILQPSNVFGWTTGARKPLLSFVKSIASGRFRIIGDGSGTLNYIPVEDVGWAIWNAASRDMPSGTYILNDPCTVSEAEVAVRQGLGEVTSCRRMPYFAAFGLATACGLARRLKLPAPSFDLRRLQELTNTTCYEPSKFLAAAGQAWQLGTLKGLAALASRYRQEQLV